MLTAERLRELFTYLPSTGEFIRRVSRGGSPAGSVAGCTDKDGYNMIMVDRTSHKAHRLAWLYTYGEWPVGDIDHINECKGDNRIINLREATRAENMQNRSKANKNGHSGLLGVTKVGKKWLGQIHVDGVRHHLGRFESPQEAHAAYLRAKHQLHKGAQA